MSRVYTRRIRLMATALVVWLCTTMSWGHAENETLKRLREAVKEYSETAKELQKIDEFHIQVALRRAVTAERPGIPYRWNNLHTNHKGEIVLLDFIGPRGNGRICVDFKHTYYLGGGSPIEDEGVACQNSEGEWDDLIVRAVFKGTGVGKQTAAIPRYNAKVVRDVQTLLDRLNYNPGPVDGIYGPRTKGAIEYYQRDEGLSITGEVSGELVARLNRSVAILEDLPSTETITVRDESKEIPPSAHLSSPELLTVDEGPRSTTPLDDSASNELAAADRIHHPTDLGSSYTDANSNKTSQREQGSDGTIVAAPAQTVRTDVNDTVGAADTNSVVINTKDNASAVSNPEDAEVTASKEKPPLSSINNVQSPIAPVPTKPKIKEQTELQGSTDLPRPLVTQVSEGQGAVDRTQIGDAEEPKSLDTTAAPYDPNWIMVFIGLMFSGVAGVVASRYLSSGINRSTARQSQMEQAAVELDNKIAIVVGQPDKGLDKGPKMDREAVARVYRHPTEGVPLPPALNKSVEAESQPVEPTVEEPDQTPLKEVPKETTETPEALPGQQQDQEDSAVDSQDTIIRAVTEFDELIKETERLLAMDLELDSRENITKAIEQATKLINKAFEKDAIEGGSHKYTRKAIRKATKLIKEALEEYSTVTSQLRVKNK